MSTQLSERLGATNTSPTLDQIKTWPATVNVEQAARALGISRSYAYEAIKVGSFPAKTLRVGSRIRVITGSIVAVLDAAAA
jgi:predicted DNA-binding transcriptional regulator AlpA